MSEKEGSMRSLASRVCVLCVVLRLNLSVDVKAIGPVRSKDPKMKVRGIEECGIEHRSVKGGRGGDIQDAPPAPLAHAHGGRVPGWFGTGITHVREGVCFTCLRPKSMLLLLREGRRLTDAGM